MTRVMKNMFGGCLQTMLKGRPPYDAEVDAEVAKEYQRVQDEKRRAKPDHGREIDAVRTRVSELEGSVTRLGENMSASHKRLEEMMQLILQNQGKKHANAGEDITEPSSSTKMLDTSALTSTTAEPTVLAHHPVPIAIVTTLAAADTRLASVVHVPCDIAEDAATEAATNNQGMHKSTDTVIASIIDDILDDEGNKSTDPLAAEDTLEPESEDVPVHAVEEANEGHPEGEGIADVLEENANPEQVTPSETQVCNLCKKFG